MKYKKHIATGALALSLLVGGTSVFAATPQDLGIKKIQQTYQKQNKNNKNIPKIKSKSKSNITGIVSLISDTGFTIEVKNVKAKTLGAVDIKTDASTTYSKNGVKAGISDLAVGQKVVISGTLDKTANILTAKQVKIVVVKTQKVKS